MGIDIGRLGSLGIGIEAAAGSAVAASTYLQYSEISLRGHHEPIEYIASKASRLMDKDSVVGKKWGEGDVGVMADTIVSGYLWKLALGNELYESGTPDNHTFYATVSGNTPKTATLIQTRGTNSGVEQYVHSAIDELNFEVSDGLATMTASFFSKFPADTSSQTVTTTSGTIIAFPQYFVQFGADLSAAASAAATPINDFAMSIANNLETIHRSGNSDVSTIRSKGMRVSGTYTLFFDSLTDRDAYYALNKRAMILTASGINNESLRIRIPEFRINDADIATGLDDFYTITANWVAEDDIDSGVRLVDVRLQNDKSSVY